MINTLITGANRGIGLELTKLLEAKQHRVTAVCRTRSRELDALGVDVVADIDVGADGAEHAIAERCGSEPLDWLIANAGILHTDTLNQLDFAGVKQQFEVNALGALRTVSALLPRLHNGSRIALITSRMGSIADNNSGNYYGYRMSKAALNAAGMSLARDLQPRGVAVAILHPGYVRTDMTGLSGGIAPSEAAAQLVARIEALSLENTGTFWHASGEVLPW